jgi:hypothetical protein
MRLLATLLLVSSVSRAQEPARPEPAKPKAAPKAGAADAKAKEGGKFYDFEGLIIDGEVKKPGAFFATARDKARFERLLKLRKSFLDQTVKSAADPSLQSVPAAK